MLLSPAPSVEHPLWASDAQGWVLRVPAQWRDGDLGPVPTTVTSGRVRVEMPPGSPLDAQKAPALWELLHPLAQKGLTVDLSALPPSLAAPLALALRQPTLHEPIGAEATKPLSPEPNPARAKPQSRGAGF